MPIKSKIALRLSALQTLVLRSLRSFAVNIFGFSLTEFGNKD